jgi:hypothetical protein
MTPTGDPSEGIRQLNIAYAGERRRKQRLRQRMFVLLVIWAVATLVIAAGLVR